MKMASRNAGHFYSMEKAKAWDEGGTNKIWLHALVGGIMSSLSGNGFAAGAGLNEALQKELAKIKDPGLHELGSMVIGAAAAKLIRQDAKTGMVTALNGTKNNWLNHMQQRAMYNELLAAGTNVNDPEVRERRAAIYSKYAALDLYNDENESIKSWNNVIDPDLLEQMSVDMDVSTDNGMTGNLAKSLSIYEANPYVQTKD
jgi:filamentous hemagglutinin